MISGLSELATMALLVPFLTALSGPERLMNLWGMRWLSSVLGVNQPDQLLLPLTIMLSASALIGALLRTSALLINSRLTASIGHDLSVTTFDSILYADYSFLVEQNSGQLISRLTAIDQFVGSALRPLLQMLSSVLIATVVGVGLLVLNPALALALAMIASCVYLLISRLSEKRLQSVNRSLSSLHENRVRLQQESMAGMRYITITSTQAYFSERYEKADSGYRKLESVASFLSLVPRYVIEGAGIALLCISTFLIFQAKGVAVAIPTIGLLTLATQRFLPAVQEAYGAATLARAHRHTLGQVLEIISQSRQARKSLPSPTSVLDTQERAPRLTHDITFNNVSFSYPYGKCVFRDINFTIPKGSRAAIMGPTGSGKSTLLDLLLGFQVPSSGAIYIDHTPLYSDLADRRRSWQSQISYVPQQVYLSDASVLENIVFPGSSESCDFNKVMAACEAACLKEFIDTLPAGLDTRIGENGAKLSGGQRQRIGIARAMYQRKPIVIWDEPTNSLDATTESRILQSLQKIPRDTTIIVVTHSARFADGLDLVLKVLPERKSVVCEPMV